MSEPWNPASNGDAEQIYRVALAYRRVFVWFGLGALANIAAVIFTAPAAPPVDPSEGISGIVYLVALPFQILMLINVYRLAQAMEKPAAFLWVIAMFVPCVSLICLLVLSSQANQWLSARGVKVGLLGPNPRTLEPGQSAGSGPQY